jgi:tetratricopeptide (TPR) repeat protein
MMPRLSRSIVRGLGLFLLLSSAAPAGDRAVRLTEAFETINEHNQLPLDPYPPFGLTTGYICYPYRFYGSKQFQVTPRKLRLLVAENEYLKIAMCPEYGGRLYYLYDKVRKREVIHRINTDAKFYNAGMGYQYVGGGLELNLPNAHSQTNARPRECVARRNADGSVSLIMSDTERIGRIHWSVAFTLSPGEARVRQDVRIANETAVESRYLYWANCGIPLRDNTEYIYPEAKGAMHGKAETVYSWPVYEGANLALIKNLDEMLGLYMLDAREGFFGYFSHDDKAGLAHYADVNDVPGKKYWSWGWHETARHTRFTHTDGQPYGEVQAGRVVIQEVFDRLLPLTSQTWTEYWYPVGDIGVFNGASAEGAARLALERREGAAAVAEIRFQAARPFEGVLFALRRGGETVASFTEASLRPERPLRREIALPASTEDLDGISLVVMDRGGRVIAEVLSRTDKPAPFDSYEKPEKPRTAKAESFTAEGVFARAEALARDWFYHLPRQKELLHECLRLDPGFSRAQAELGLLDFQAGQFEAALRRFDRALERIPDDGRVLYYKGLALRHLGRTRDAHYFLRHSGRFGFEAAERIAEAEMEIAAGNLEAADRHLARATAVNGTVLKGFILRSLVARRQGRQEAARRSLEAARALDPENPLVGCSGWLLAGSPGPLGAALRERYGRHQDEFLEIAAVLYSAGLREESARVLGLIETETDIVRLYREELGSGVRRMSGAAANAAAPVRDFAWRLEEFLILKDRLAKNPDDAELLYHLGNFAYAHDLEADGIAYWEAAAGRGFRDKVSLSSLYRAKKKLDFSGEPAFAHLIEALALDPDDPYLFDDYVSEIRSRKGLEEGIKVLEANIDRFLACFTTCGTLMDAYLRTGAYDKLDKFIGRVEFRNYWRTSLGSYAMLAKMARGYRKLKEAKYAEALADFEAAPRVPENLAAHYLPDMPSQARRLFYIGYCRAKLGNEEAARRAWTEALAINQRVRFETSAAYNLMNTRYYQAFCLRGLGRHAEADVMLDSLREFAGSLALASATDESKKHLLRLAVLGRERDLDRFPDFDTELGITSFAGLATSVED